MEERHNDVYLTRIKVELYKRSGLAADIIVENIVMLQLAYFIFVLEFGNLLIINGWFAYDCKKCVFVEIVTF